jgi:hypothetical protein
VALLRTDKLGLCSVMSDGERLLFTTAQWERPARGRYTPF